MNSEPDAAFRRLKIIERNIAGLRIFVAIVPVWVVGDVLIRLSPENMWGYGVTAVRPGTVTP